MTCEEMIGKEYGYWTVLSVADPKIDISGRRKLALLCRCRCGTERVVTKNTLLNGRSKSCGCYHRERMHETSYEDLVGQRFEHLLVKKDIGRRGTSTLWLCLCDCGNYTEATTADLRRRHKVSCGCYAKSMRITHGGSKERLYQEWLSMRRRCYDKNTIGWDIYGGRGIIVCEEWSNDYDAFRKWSYENGYDDTLTLDRINYDGNYCPDNCRWITKHDQCRNTRYNRFETMNGETKTVIDWCEHFGLSEAETKRVYVRLRHGWPIKEALFEPPCPGKRHKFNVSNN